MDLLYLNRDDVVALGGENMTLAVADMERVFQIRQQGDVRVPDKVSMNFGKTIAEEKTLGRINAMLGYLGAEYGLAGIKWIGSNPANLQKGLPRASAITILNDPDTKFPLAIMDGTVISNERTGAVIGVAAKVFAKKNAKAMLLFGAGLIGEKASEAVKVGCPSLEVIYIYDLVPERAEKFAEKVSRMLGIPVKATADAKAAAENCDIIVTATGASSPVIDFSFMHPGCLYINVGGYECSYDMVEQCDIRYVDNWAAVKHRNTSAIAKMVNEGVLPEEKVDGEIGEVLEGAKPGRTGENQTVFFNCVGMGIEDIAIATRVYRKAQETGAGTVLKYW